MDLLREINSILVKKTKYSVFGQLFLTLIMIIATWQAQRFAVFAGFVMVLILLNLLRYGCLIYYPLMRRHGEKSWFLVYSAMTVGTGLAWSLNCCWAVLTFGAQDQIFLLLVAIVAGLTAGATAVLTPARWLARLFVMSLILPVVFTMLFLLSSPQIILSAIILFFMFFLFTQINLQTELVWELRARRSQVHAFEEATMEAIIIHENGRILQVNSSFEKMFGYTREEVVGRSIKSLSPQDAQDEQSRHDNGQYRDERTPQSFRSIRKDGSVFYVDVVGRWFSYEGRRVRVTCVLDATARKQAEEILQDREKAALESVETKAQFLANMSHEIRTPLNAIIGLTNLLSETELTGTQKHYFRTLKESGDALMILINDILDFSKIDAQKIELENVAFSLSTVVEAQVDLMFNRAAPKEVALHALIEPDLPSMVVGDYGRVGQILLNLISNAIKFTARGSVLVLVRPVAGPAEANGKSVRVRFEVQDTGMGIDDSQKAKLFKPFTQADNSMARKFGGTGLGLSICQKLVELMNGRIDFESEPNKGTTFWFEVDFPIADPKSIAATLSSSSWPPIRAVIVCEEVILARVLQRYLQSWDIPSILGAPESVQLDEADIVFVSSGATLKKFSESASIPLKEAGATANKKVVLIAGDEEKWAEKWNDHPLVHTKLALPLRYADVFGALAEMFGPVKPALPAQLEALNESFAGYRVLVAEDNSTNQLIILALLRQLGMTCHAVANGNEVVDAFRHGEYDIILMDCQMPELDGFQATARIRELEKTMQSRIPIVALTANVLKEDRDRCFAAGMDDFLSKPIPKQKLISVFKKYLVDELKVAN